MSRIRETADGFTATDELKFQDAVKTLKNSIGCDAAQDFRKSSRAYTVLGNRKLVSADADISP